LKEKTLTETRAPTAAEVLLAAHREGSLLRELDESLVPEDLAAAYAVQDALVRGLGHGIGGWKIGAGTGPNPGCSPLPQTAYLDSGDDLKVTDKALRVVEAEVAVRFGRDLPPRAEDYSEDEIRAAIASLHPSLEILGSRFDPRLTVPRLLAGADFQSNAAIAVGPPKVDWKDIDLSQLGITLTIGDQQTSVDSGPTTGDVFSALTWLANGRARDHGGFKAGQVLITGARAKAPIGRPGETAHADFGVLGQVSLRFI
jgi:2-keto-4-pentenoate hydratase